MIQADRFAGSKSTRRTTGGCRSSAASPRSTPWSTRAVAEHSASLQVAASRGWSGGSSDTPPRRSSMPAAHAAAIRAHRDSPAADPRHREGQRRHLVDILAERFRMLLVRLHRHGSGLPHRPHSGGEV